MLNFKKYNSIENVYREKFINMIQLSGLGSGTWYVEEKIHGANFSVWFDGAEVRFAKRSGFIEEGGAFYGYETLIPELTEAIHAIFKQLNLKAGEDTVTLFGELFGGGYPHPNVKRDPNALRVQKGVFYCPENKFYAFDIFLNEEYLGIPKFHEVCEAAGVFYAKPLFSGNLKDAIAHSNEFQTTLPEIFGLPEIEENICEGVVIKPETPRYLASGSRVIIKSKNAKFSEKEKTPEKKGIVLSDECNGLFNEMISYRTENRLVNVISKIGEVAIKDFGKVLGLFNQDILADFKKDFGEQFSELEKADQKILQSHLNKASAVVVREHLLKL